MKNYFRLLTALVFAVALISCSEQNAPTDPDANQSTILQKGASSPAITSISSNAAEIGDLITITGNSFGTKKGSSYYVTINGIQATVYPSWKPNAIEVIVPSGGIPNTSGQLIVNAGTSASNAVSFTVLESTPVTIGTQIWMGANLSVTKYLNGDDIPEVTDPTVWGSLTTGAWCYYNNDASTEPLYGRLYNWYAVNDGRGLAPTGWHVASDNDYKALSIYLGMSQAEADMSGGYFGTTEGSKLKEMGTSLWQWAYASATNSSGFTALPGGIRKVGAIFDFVGSYAGWWTSTDDVSGGAAWYRGVHYASSQILRMAIGKERGMSVRCVQNQ
ncbi:MAG: FISUMP domain-containing protein [Bacteroidota bacterium]